MLKLCVIALIGGILEGFMGFGFSFILLFYLLKSETALKDGIATCGFINIFISTILTLFSIFCGNFDILTFLLVFTYTLLVTCGFQYLMDTYLQRNIKATSLNSTLIIIVMIVLIMCLFSVILSFLLSWVRFGW